MIYLPDKANSFGVRSSDSVVGIAARISRRGELRSKFGSSLLNSDFGG
jgi:hypothetical protein